MGHSRERRGGAGRGSTRQSWSRRGSARAGTALGGAAALALAVPGAFTPPPLRAGDLTQDCHRWARASGNARIAVANQLGADHLLTKNTRLAESDPSQPVELYRFGDLQRLCRGT